MSVQSVNKNESPHSNSNGDSLSVTEIKTKGDVTKMSKPETETDSTLTKRVNGKTKTDDSAAKDSAKNNSDNVSSPSGTAWSIEAADASASSQTASVVDTSTSTSSSSATEATASPASSTSSTEANALVNAEQNPILRAIQSNCLTNYIYGVIKKRWRTIIFWGGLGYMSLFYCQQFVHDVLYYPRRYPRWKSGDGQYKNKFNIPQMYSQLVDYLSNETLDTKNSNYGYHFEKISYPVEIEQSRNWMLHAALGPFAPFLGYRPGHFPFFKQQTQGTGFFLYPKAPIKKSSTKNKLTIWICQGGNAMKALDWVQFLYMFLDLYRDKTTFDERNSNHHAFLLLDYPGYGYNEGKPSPTNIHLHLDAAINEVLGDEWVMQLGENKQNQKGKKQTKFVKWFAEHYDDVRFSGLGHSLGASAILTYQAKALKSQGLGLRQGETLQNENKYACSNKECKVLLDRVVLSAPFLSIYHMAHHIFKPIVEKVPKTVTQFAIGENRGFDNLSAMQIVTRAMPPGAGSDEEIKKSHTNNLYSEKKPYWYTRVSVIHGTNDEVIPFNHGKRLFDFYQKQQTQKQLDEHKKQNQFIPVFGGTHNDILHKAASDIVGMMTSTD